VCTDTCILVCTDTCILVCTDTCILVCTDTCILVNVALNNYNPHFLMDNIEFLETNNFDIYFINTLRIIYFV
jgi:hypothetical protein